MPERAHTKPTDAATDDEALAGAETAAAREAAELAADGEVRAESVTITQGGADHVVAGEVTVRQGGIGRLEARDVAVTQGGIGLARGDRVSVELGALGGAIAREVRMTQAAANGIVAREVHVGQSIVRSILAADVRIDRPSGVVFLLARRVEGDVRVLFDWRAGLAFGAAFGLVAALLRRR